MTEAKAKPKTMADGPQESYPVTFKSDKRTFVTSDPATVIRLDASDEWQRAQKKS